MTADMRFEQYRRLEFRKQTARIFLKIWKTRKKLQKTRMYFGCEISKLKQSLAGASFTKKWLSGFYLSRRCKGP